MEKHDRREFLQAGVVAMAAIIRTQPLAAEAKIVSTDVQDGAFSHTHSPKPLPFNPKALRGLSERLIVSHWENNYGGAVKALNTVRERLQAMRRLNEPPYLYNDLKREHLVRTGSVVLHELYFENLGGDGKAPEGVRSRIGRAFGSFDAWESEFRRIGQGLGGGSGWVVLGMNEHLGILENYWLADHASNPPHTKPILVLDMYEHAYHIDYGAAAAKYIDAFFDNANWEAVATRLSG